VEGFVLLLASQENALQFVIPQAVFTNSDIDVFFS